MMMFDDKVDDMSKKYTRKGKKVGQGKNLSFQVRWENSRHQKDISKLTELYQERRKGGEGGLVADQLTLFQLGGQIMPNTLLLATPDFWMVRRLC